MKKIYIIIGLVLTLFSACSDFTEIQPKGKNLLSSDQEIDMLLNFDYSGYVHFGFQTGGDLNLLTNDVYPLTNIQTLVSSTVASDQKAYFQWDESIDRKKLSTTDQTYSDLYSIIGTVANPVIEKADGASGDAALLKRYKAEAYALRAYAHFLLVNIYAKAYDTSTAATDGGIYYQKEGTDAQATVTQSTVKEVYDNILSDINTAIELDALPDKSENNMRVSKPFAYGVKAEVLAAMKDYTGAEEAARQCLAINDTIIDYNDLVSGGQFIYSKTGTAQDLLMMPASTMGEAFSPEMLNVFEQGNVVRNDYPSDVKLYGMKLYASTYGEGVDLDGTWFSSDSFVNNLGLSTPEIYLLLAECDIRKGNYEEALSIMNKLRRKRIEPSAYEDWTTEAVADKATAIKSLQRLSREENWFNFWNFCTIKRWNTETEWQQTLTKTVLGKTYTLAPSSTLWLKPFPTDAMTINSELKQNY